MSQVAARPLNHGLIKGLLGVCALATVMSQAKIQTWAAEDTKAQARKANRYGVTKAVVASRGRILDRNRAPLAQDSPITELVVDYRKAPSSPGFWAALSDATGIPANEFTAIGSVTEKSRSWVVSLSSDQRNRIAAIRKFWRPDGVSISGKGERENVLGDATSPIIGGFRHQLAKDNKTKVTVATGLESTQDALLKGKDGKQVGFADKNGNLLPNRLIESLCIPKADGQDIETTIDATLQASAYAALKETVVANGANEGSAVVLDPRTGDVLALVTYPTFSSSEFAKGTGVPFGANPATKNRFEPGSTFKILTLAKALDEGKTSMSEHFYCRLTMQVGKRTIGCDRKHGAHGDVDATKAIAKSCNVTAATWAMRVGHPAFTKYMTDLGLFEPTGVELGGEVAGSYNKKEYSKILQLATFGFGQSLTCTPISLASAFSTIANEGKRVPPRLIRRLGDETVERPKAKQIISAETAREVLETMEAVIETKAGTGYSLRIPGYRLAGKTGTAEKIGSVDPITKKKISGYVANFIGFVPAVRPQAVVLVMVDNPKKQIYGGAVAGPAFRQIALSVIKSMRIPPDRSEQPVREGGDT